MKTCNANRVAIMQPYFLPYLGYWQLMNYVDKFVIYDDVKFTKTGWIHRNRYLNNGLDQMFTLPLKKASDYLDICDRQLSDNWGVEKNRIIRKIEGSYNKAPFFKEGMAILENCLDLPETNLFDFILHSIQTVKCKLGIETELFVSSEIDNARKLRGKNRVIELCGLLGAGEYVNPIGGRELYKKEDFKMKGVTLKFHRIQEVTYDQFNHDFISNLSIIDVLMFNGVDGTKRLLSMFDLV